MKRMTMVYISKSSYIMVPCLLSFNCYCVYAETLKHCGMCYVEYYVNAIGLKS